MPAEIVTGEFCASYYGTYFVPGSKGETYAVVMSGTGAHCTCKAFQFSGESRSCKHIERVYAEACMWNCQWHDGNAPVMRKPDEVHAPHVIPNETCPNCGGPVVPVRIAV